MKLALAAMLTSCMAVCALPAAAQTGVAPARAQESVVEPESRWAPTMPFSVGVVGGTSLRGGQAGVRVNVGLGSRLSLDLGADYWGWIHFRDQNHLVVARAHLRIGRRAQSGWHTVGLVGGTVALNTTGYTSTLGVGWEREYATRRVSVEVGLTMYTIFANVSVLFGPRR